MKILKDGSIGFYTSKWNYAALLFIPAWIIFILFSAGNNPLNSQAGYIMAAVCAAVILIFIYLVFIDKKPYVKLRHDCIEIRGMAPVLWDDIYAMYIESRRVGKRGRHDFMCFKVRDLSFYKLTLAQKIQNKFGTTPFAVDLDLMPKKERELFRREIHARLKRDIENLAQK